MVYHLRCGNCSRYNYVVSSLGQCQWTCLEPMCAAVNVSSLPTNPDGSLIDDPTLVDALVSTDPTTWPGAVATAVPIGG
jgi:hypothetical protein